MPVSTPTRRLWIFYIPYLVLAIGLGLALLGVQDSQNDNKDEARARSAGNATSIRIGCESTNDLASAIRVIIANTGTAIPPDALAGFHFQDPEVERFVEGVIERSQEGADRLHASADRIKLLDCDALARRGTSPGR